MQSEVSLGVVTMYSLYFVLGRHLATFRYFKEFYFKFRYFVCGSEEATYFVTFDLFLTHSSHLKCCTVCTAQFTTEKVLQKVKEATI